MTTIIPLPNGGSLTLPAGIDPTGAEAEILVNEAINKSNVDPSSSSFIDTVEGIVSDVGESMENYDWSEAPSDVAEHLYENKFAYTLGALGLLGGPILSAALQTAGTGIDAALSDEERNAGDEMLLSAGIDTAILATLKIPPGLYRLVVNRLKTGRNPSEIVEAITKDATEDIGTKAATRQSQKIMLAAGATLTQGQAGKKGGLTEIMEGISFTGILSSQVHKNNLNKIADFSKKAMQNLFNSNQRNITARELGDTINSNLKTARQALIDTHGQSLAQISKEFGKDHNVDLSTIGKFLNKWNSSKTYTPAKGVNPKDGSETIIKQSKLEPQTQKIIQDLQSGFGNMKKGSAMSYIDFMTELNKKINSLSDFKQQATYSPVAVRELTEFSNYMRGIAYSELKKANPSAALKFRKAQKTYAYTTSRLFPDINDTFIKSVDKNGIYQLGDMVTQMHNVENVQKLYKSLDAAYAATSPSIRKNLKVKSPEGVKQLIRRRYLEQTFPLSKNLEELNFGEFQKMAVRLSNPDEALLAKEILGGKEFNGFKAIVNTLAKASETPGSNFASLAIRGKEISATTAIGSTSLAGGLALTTAGVGGLAAPVVAITGGLGILFTPKILAGIISDPSKVNKFLGLKAIKNKEKLFQNAAVIANDAWKELDPDQKSELVEGLTPEVVSDYSTMPLGS
jgi:hypothetical protein